MIGNRLAGGGRYGFLMVGSANNRVTDNTALLSTRLGFISICMHNVTGNQILVHYVTIYDAALRVLH